MRSNVLISRFVNTLDSMDQAGKRIPGLLLSHPGFGKTSTIRMFAEYKNYNCVELIPSQYAPDDVVGIQVYENGSLVRKEPAWFRKVVDKAEEKRTILFIDEITTCNPYIQGPLLDLIFSRSTLFPYTTLFRSLFKIHRRSKTSRERVHRRCR